MRGTRRTAALQQVQPTLPLPDPNLNPIINPSLLLILGAMAGATGGAAKVEGGSIEDVDYVAGSSERCSTYASH